ncbi:MAG: hypothetical protein MHM6MM_004453 [Cercozoa sp. M6MM]
MEPRLVVLEKPIIDLSTESLRRANDVLIEVSAELDSGANFSGLTHQTLQLRFGAFLDRFECKESDSQVRTYLSQVALYKSGEATPLGASLGVDTSLCPTGQERLVSVHMWMSPRATRSALHWDAWHNALCVLEGSKKVVLLPPKAADFPEIDACAVWEGTIQHSRCTFERALELARTTYRKDAVVRTVRANECLLLPAGWWHAVESEAGTKAVNFWSSPPDDYLAMHTDKPGEIDANREVFWLRMCQEKRLFRLRDQALQRLLETVYGDDSDNVNSSVVRACKHRDWPALCELVVLDNFASEVTPVTATLLTRTIDSASGDDVVFDGQSSTPQHVEALLEVLSPAARRCLWSRSIDFMRSLSD